MKTRQPETNSNEPVGRTSHATTSNDGWASAGPPTDLSDSEGSYQPQGLSIDDVVTGLREHGRTVALLMVLGTVLALIFSVLQPKEYESTATGVVMARVESDVDSSLAGDDLAKSKAVSYGVLAESRPVAERSIEALRLEDRPEEVLQRIVVSAPADTTVLNVTAQAPTAEEAISLAGGWMSALSEQIEIVETASQATENTPAAVALQPLGRPTVPEGPTSPNLSVNLPLGGLAGLLIGSVYAMVRYRRTRGRL